MNSTLKQQVTNRIKAIPDINYRTESDLEFAVDAIVSMCEKECLKARIDEVGRARKTFGV